MLWGAERCRGVLWGVVGCCGVPWGAVGHWVVLWGAGRCCGVLWGVVGHWEVLWGAVGRCPPLTPPLCAQTYFEDNPRDLHVLRHDKALHAAIVKPHLRNVPDYLGAAGGLRGDGGGLRG